MGYIKEDETKLAVATPAEDNAVALLEDDEEAIIRVAKQAQKMSGSAIQYIKFSKGEWQVGRESTPFPQNQFNFVCQLKNVQHGWQCWKDSAVVDQVLLPITTDLPSKERLPDHGPYAKKNDGWSKCVRIDGHVVPSRELGIPNFFEFSLNLATAGGIGAVGKLMTEWANLKIAGGASLKGKVPLVEATVGSYKHSEYGKVYIPVFAIKEWVNYSEIMAIVEGVDTGATARPDVEEVAAADKPAVVAAAAQQDLKDVTPAKPKVTGAVQAETFTL